MRSERRGEVGMSASTSQADYRVVIVRGADADFEVVFRQAESGVPLDLSVIEVKCEVKDRPGGKELFKAIVTKTDPANGLVTVRFPKEETAKLAANSFVYFDFLLKWPDGTEKNYPVPPIKGKVIDRVTDEG